MKKLLLLLSAMLLIFSYSFAQKNVRAGKLTVKKDAIFIASATFYDNISAKVITQNALVTASGGWGDSYVLIMGKDADFATTIVTPQTIILTGGSCDGQSVTITTAAWQSGTIACSVDGATPCTDYSGTSLVTASNKLITSENHFDLYGNLNLNDRYKFHSYLLVDDGPMSSFGTMIQIIPSKDYTEDIADATHIFYTNPNMRGHYFKIDSIEWNGTNTLIYSGSLVSGLISSIDDIYLYTMLQPAGNITMKGNLTIGDQADEDYNFSLHGDAKITGRLRTHIIGDTGIMNYTPTAAFISSDTILVGKEYGDLTKILSPGDSIAKSDLSWIREIKTIEYGDYSYLGYPYSYCSVITYNGSAIGDAGQTSCKSWHYPDLEITLSEGNNLYVKTFKGSNNVTGWIMINENGDPCYVYPNAAGNGITVSTTKP